VPGDSASILTLRFQTTSFFTNHITSKSIIMNPSIANFVVLTWPQGGPNERLINNLPNTSEYTYVASAINIMLSMVESD
jgi:hypothetical protein